MCVVLYLYLNGFKKFFVEHIEQMIFFIFDYSIIYHGCELSTNGYADAVSDKFC